MVKLSDFNTVANPLILKTSPCHLLKFIFNQRSRWHKYCIGFKSIILKKKNQIPLENTYGKSVPVKYTYTPTATLQKFI